ncbi:non-homologous end-joining DNA ligase [Phytohabitans sp. ZYX-F-186]|uniref:Non-homologous end-joining DNA ligase n=1 Tax=Phytohabitans maris TaxID=3071409 RepID=A0ABU0ZVM3_9ACTN|nr:non-homologous end-joining DNA ligase [Phytohabitans sp. ZYX-F-186]MDQ7910547.1 non-homologous end-joining DNA ligase [Phytohabitans sp. ZYX-F-186]
MAEQRIRVEVEGQSLELSNLDKVLYPAAGFTKGEIINYYTRVAPALLPHLRDRALTRIRFPNGVDGQSFFEKNKPGGTPEWVRVETMPVPGSTKDRETIDYVVADDLPTLVWLANLAALELHTPQWRIGNAAGLAGSGPRSAATRPDDAGRSGRSASEVSAAGMAPDLMVVDLDPGAPAGLRECCAVAVLMRDRLAQDGLTAYPKTSGKKGMQLSCPIAGTQTAEEVSAYAKRIAEELERDTPKSITSKMTKRLRSGKVFIDWSQNSAAKTTVAPYSLRAQATPTVSTPLTWEEVEEGGARAFTPEEVLERVEEYGDLLEDLLTPGPSLPG